MRYYDTNRLVLTSGREISIGICIEKMSRPKGIKIIYNITDASMDLEIILGNYVSSDIISGVCERIPWYKLAFKMNVWSSHYINCDLKYTDGYSEKVKIRISYILCNNGISNLVSNQAL